MKKHIIKTITTIICGTALSTNLALATGIINTKDLEPANKLSLNTTQTILYQNTLEFVNNLKTLDTESKFELETRLEALRNYILYPIILTNVIKKFPDDFPLIKYIDYLNTYFPKTNFTKDTIDRTFLYYSNNEDFNSINLNVEVLGKDYPYNLTSLCAIGNSELNSGTQYDKLELSNIFNQALAQRYINSCSSFLNAYVDNQLINETNTIAIKDFILNNATTSRINLIKRLDKITSLNYQNASLANYAITIVENPKTILENNHTTEKDLLEIDSSNTRNLASKFGFKNDQDLLSFIDLVNSSQASPAIKKQAIAEYIEINYYKISADLVKQYITTYYTDRTLEQSIRRAIASKQPYLQYINLLSVDRQNNSEWLYWKAKAMQASNPRQAKQLLEQVLNQPGFYGLLAAKTLGKPYKVVNSMVYSLDKAPDLQKEFSWYAEAIKEANKLNDTNLALYIWRNFEVDNNYTGLINWSYRNNLYYLGVNSSIRQGLRENLAARFPNAYDHIFANTTKNLLVSKTFAQAIARQESAWNYNAKSSANAYGLMQFINATAARTAKNMGIDYTGVSNLYNPEYAINLGSYHLSELLEQNDNNRMLAAIGYNAGPRRISQWLNNSNGQLNFDEFVATIPFNETRNYVMNTLTFDYYSQVLQGYKNPVIFYDSEWNRKY
ncbi:transglycosylase SLT domain-containing protein [Psittacicella gerlachiana]|uniref:Transglycosylase SLT domain-containing protein n=1 Tax=Psittacicella gerlachiana TaxID=2028574 RepID=A0A3A1Y8E5_9GAMM|nr:transglycosylase SLT domain-containing protein [Psittacicella gerlachiana]RIY33811.1 hypothetical protein CKF59_06155 [Psittacicella gerlachiana]